MQSPAFAELLNLDGRTALVTGAGHGIGAAIATRLAAAGARVAVHYRNDERGAGEVVEAVAAAGGEAWAIAADLGDEASAGNLLRAVAKQFDNVDILVNNAGVFPVSGLLDMTADDWHSMYRANLDTAFFCTQAAARAMKDRGGAIVNIASIGALSPGPQHSHYNSAKAALVMFTRSAAQEFGAWDIRVNSVSPGVIHRPGIEEEWPDGVRRWLARAPLSRLGQPDDVADACLFLASPAARWITGHNLVVDGGMLSASMF